MKIDPIPKEDIPSGIWTKWFSSLFEFTKKPEFTGDVIIDNPESGLVLKDSSNNYWRVRIVSGVLNVTSLGSTKP